MDKFRIKGGKVLRGTVAISGAKNSALPVMAAALLTAEKVTLHNIPKVRDLITMSKLLAFMDAKVSVTEMPASDYVIEALKLNHVEAPYELVKTMRASVLTLGPLMARVGLARVSSGNRGFEDRTFGCATCHRIEKISFGIDLMKPGVGSLDSELRRPR